MDLFLKNAHPSIKRYIMSGDFDSDISQICDKHFLEDSEALEVSNIAAMILLGIIPPTDLQSEILENTSLTPNLCNDLAYDITNILLEPLQNFLSLNGYPKTINQVGDSFERTILNQAMAMRRVGEAPANLPTSQNTPKFGPRNEENRAEPTQNNQQNAIHNYVPGSDPYREPIE